MPEKSDVPQGTLALVVLKTLDLPGPLHGYGIARRFEISGDHLAVTGVGRRQLQTETGDWERTAAVIERFVAVKAEDLS